MKEDSIAIVEHRQPNVASEILEQRRWESLDSFIHRVATHVDGCNYQDSELQIINVTFILK